MDEMFIREKIAKLRTNKNISARELSLRLGQSEGYINSIENGRANPSVEMLRYILEELGVSFSEFFEEENNNPDLIRELIKEAKRLDRKTLESLLNIIKHMK